MTISLDPVERDFRLDRRTGTDPKSFTSDRATIPGASVEVDMGFINVNQQAEVVKGIVEHSLKPFLKGTLGRIAVIQ